MSTDHDCLMPIPAVNLIARRTKRSFYLFVIGIAGLVLPLLAVWDLSLMVLLILVTTPLFVLSADAGLRVGTTRWFVLLWALPAMILSLIGVLYWGAAIAWLVVILMI